jgi:alkaline phosphatase D
MSKISRRDFLAAAAAVGASAAWAGAHAITSRASWRERKSLYPEGVASGDPDSNSVLLWTRRPHADGRKSAQLLCEVAEDRDFRRVIASAKPLALAESDWTVRVLAGGLKPRSVYWYRFMDADGNGSRIGRTVTAPADDDPRPVRFAFVSCQNANQGAQNSYRRMIYEDGRAAPEDRLGFVLHLGDFIYELVWYPEDRPQGMYDRRLRDVVRYERGQKIEDFHIPTTTAGYRAAYKGYLHDPDIQDARAHFPFVTMWDNHEFSWLGWQSLQQFGGPNIPAQTRKVAANQAWYEYHPARVGKPLDKFDPPAVADAAVTRFDDDGLGQEPNNLAAIGSLTGYRALRWGRNVELIITDQHSYRSEDPMGRGEAGVFASKTFPQFFPEDVQLALDGGRAYNGGNPPLKLRAGDTEVANFRRQEPPQTILGARQKAWFLQRLQSSAATWKIWGNTNATLDMRADPQNLPADFPHWPYTGYAGFGGGDWSTNYMERAEVYDAVARAGITGFAVIAGDRHSFWAGLASKSLPPRGFEPVGIAFVTGSISAPGMVEALEYKLPKDHPMRAVFLADRAGREKPEPTLNLLVKHGVRTAIEYARSGDLAKAHALSNPDNAPHVAFADLGGHGYAVVTAGADYLETEFVCIPRPLERSASEDGGPLRYRVAHRAKLWAKGERPVLEQRVIEGDAGLSI